MFLNYWLTTNRHVYNEIIAIIQKKYIWSCCDFVCMVKPWQKLARTLIRPVYLTKDMKKSHKLINEMLGRWH